MNTISSVPSCSLSFARIGRWFHLKSIDLAIPDDLKPRSYVPFSYDLDFAGHSPRGIFLSIRRSAGPARIGSYPLLNEVPPGWIAFDCESGLLFTTDQPRLAFVGIGGSLCRIYGTLAVHPADLATVIESAQKSREPGACEVALDEVSPELVRLAAQHSQAIKIVLAGWRIFVRIPADVRLSEREWRILDRHIFTGQPVGTFDETVSCKASPWGLIALPGESVGEVMARWGVGSAKPCAYRDKTLFFQSITVKDAAKLSLRFPQTKLLSRRVLSVKESDVARHRRTWAEEPLTDSTDEYYDEENGLESFSLHQAALAGIIPGKEDLKVDSDLEYVYLPRSQVQISELKCPVESGLGQILCPQHLMESNFMSASKAARKYRLSPALKKHKAISCDARGAEISLPGTYYLVSDLAGLPERDIRSERAERQARRERLFTRYGSDLPSDYEDYSDVDLERYFEIKDAVARGELVSVINHSLLPEHDWHRGPVLSWISERKPGWVVQCPIIETTYLRAGLNLEDLVGLPDIWTLVEQICGESQWLRRLMLSPKFRAAALADAI